MREVIEDLLRWWSDGAAVGVATVTAATGSSPRMPGSTMLVGPGGEVVGSVSGGCVEAAVYEAAREARDGDVPALLSYGVADDQAFEIGLTCGGRIEIFVHRADSSTFPGLGQVAADIAAGRAVATATVIEHPDQGLVGTHLVVRPDGVSAPAGISPRMRDAIAAGAQGLLAAGRSDVISLGADGERLGSETRVFVTSVAPPPRLIVVGAIDLSQALAEVGRLLGYRVTVCDPRPVFATHARFPAADEVAVEWPQKYLRAEGEAGRTDERTVVCVLTHDQRFDVPTLREALALDSVGFIGAMGSRRTHDDRTRRLREAGVSERDLARISSPIGLDLGARTPQETALSIMSEVVATRWRGSGLPLSATVGRIHHEPFGAYAP